MYNFLFIQIQPQVAVNSIIKEKSFALLCYLEVIIFFIQTLFRQANFPEFLHHYQAHFAGRLIEYEDFREFYEAEMRRLYVGDEPNQLVMMNKVDWQKFIFGLGLPHFYPDTSKLYI